MKIMACVLSLVVLTAGAVEPKTQKESTVKITRITPVLAVPEVEPCVKFWVERMGFQKTAEAPEADGKTLAFAALEKDGVELMYQSYASVKADNAAMAEVASKSKAFLYVEVDNLDAVIGAMRGAEIAVPLRTMPYGMKELGIKDPAGHIILFAQRVATHS